MFDATSAAVIRAAAYPSDLRLPPWPDLTTQAPADWATWLREVWDLPGFAPAVTQAAPDLATQIARDLSSELPAPRRLHRTVESTVRYLLRWTTRATPFGHFAGVAPVDFGAHAHIRWGDDHQESLRPDGEFVDEHAARAEGDPEVLRHSLVVANPVGFARGGRWVLPCARVENGRVLDTEIGLSEVVGCALQAASAPVTFDELTATIVDRLAANPSAVQRLLLNLVGVRALLSEVRPPMTSVDPAEHLSRFVELPDPGGRVAVDLRLDCAVTLPSAVVQEACEAASALVRVAPQLPGWVTYHGAFIERWGPGAAVPLAEVVRVLGFPTGYRGSNCREHAADRMSREDLLAELAQRSALDGCAEVLLDDDLVGQLRDPDDDRQPIPHTELRFVLAAESLHDLDRGDFTLTVVSGARHAGAATARFLHLLTQPELQRFREVYAGLPTSLPGAHIVQLSGPPLEARLTTLARVPQVLSILPVGEYHSAPQHALADLAVAADGRRLWLVTPTGELIEPLLLNSVMLATAQQPITRFLTEIWTAWDAPCMPFDWGWARTLPFLPRVRRGRSILHPARWSVPSAALPPRAATWPQWTNAWQRLRERWLVPREVQLGSSDVRVRLDLDEAAHLALVRSDLERYGRAVLTEAPGRAGWIGCRPAELLVTLTRKHPISPARPPRPARPANLIQHWPGHDRWLDARLHGHVDEILVALVGQAALLPVGWWFLRHPNPDGARQHLRLRIPIRSADQFANVARQLADVAGLLDGLDVLSDYTLATYRPETRHGNGPTLQAAEAVFAADSRSVLTRLGGDRLAVTAASMCAIADAFTGDGAVWLAHHVPRRSGPRLSTDQLAHARRPYRDDALAAALRSYRARVDHDALDPDRLLADLLHLHHARMIGVDESSERQCLRLARAAAHATLVNRP
jgi:thiopeptide-type bacteriocin biosynthesis protein